MQEVLILKTGGTFSKVYEPLSGELVVPDSNNALDAIIKTAFLGNGNVSIKSIINKDSLDFTDEDRTLLVQEITHAPQKHIIVVHGTDTMNLSAACVEEAHLDKVVVFTGAMRPFSICKIESTSNFSMAYGFLSASPQNGVYIAMHGLTEKAQNIFKDKSKGVFLKKDDI